MPRLRQITCQIEWPETGLKFEEYGTVYGDGLVETFIAVPDKPQPFSVHLTSKGYVAEGLAMLVYIDGEYQCNRNRLHLKPPKKGQARDQTDVDFRLRQKEKTIGGGTFIGRDWRFDCHNIVPNGQFLGGFDPSHFDQLGMIEVIVLRCRARSGDDSGSESLTHESILGEIDKLGQALEDPSAPDAGAENYSAAIANGPEYADELAGLAALPGNYGNDGAADDVAPHHSGLNGEAPPPGYWTYHPQHPPARNEYGAENRPGRRVHFDHGSPRTPYYPTRTQSYLHRGPISGGDRAGIASNGQSTWHGRGPADYSGSSSMPAWHGTAQRAPAYAEKGGTGWVWNMSNEAPYGYGDPVANEYSDYDDTQPYIAPQRPTAPHQPGWIAPGYATAVHSSWNPASSATYPVITPRPQFLADPSYTTNTVGYPPFYASPYDFQGPGYMVNYPVPAGGWPGNQGGRTGSLDPAKDENNRGQQNNSGNQMQNSGWETNDGNNNNNSSNNNDAAANDTTAGAWGQGGDANEASNDSGWQNDGDQNNNNLGNQQSGNDANANNDWGDPQTRNNGNNDTQGNWDGNGNDGVNNAQNNTETQGNWDNNASDAQNNNNQTQGNWDNSDNNQPQQTQDSWNTNVQSMPAISTSHRSTRPLYGPYGAYYSSHARAAHTADGLSPAAEAEEEPPFDVPESVVAERGTTHQVQPGRGYMYVHKRASPEYVDGIEEPYARFVFKYRTKEQIEREIGVTINCEPTGNEEKRKYTDKTQDELIELLLRAQNALGGKIPSPPPPPAAAGLAGVEGGADENKSFNAAPVPAPTGYKYLKYELPKGRNPGLGISGGGGGNAAPQAQAQQQASGGGGGDWNMSSSGPAGGWGAPTPSGQQGASNWQTAAGNQNQKQNQWGGGGGGNSNGQNANANASKHSSPGDGGWGPAVPAAATTTGGLQGAAAPAGGAW